MRYLLLSSRIIEHFLPRIPGRWSTCFGSRGWGFGCSRYGVVPSCYLFDRGNYWFHVQILSIWLIALSTGRRDSYRGGRYSRNCGKVSSYEWVKAICVYMRKLFMKNLRRLSERPHPEKEGTERTGGEVRCPRFLETHYREIHCRNRRHWCKTCCSFRCMEYGTYNSAQIMWIVQMHLPNWKTVWARRQWHSSTFGCGKRYPCK